MKRVVMMLMAGVLLGGVLALQKAQADDPEYLWREALRTVVTTNGLAVQSDTNTTTVTADYTPAYQGQLLLGGGGGGTNAVWVSKGTTTNDWVQVAP